MAVGTCEAALMVQMMFQCFNADREKVNFETGKDNCEKAEINE